MRSIVLMRQRVFQTTTLLLYETVGVILFLFLLWYAYFTVNLNNDEDNKDVMALHCASEV